MKIRKTGDLIMNEKCDERRPDPLEEVRSLYTELALQPEKDFGWGNHYQLSSIVKKNSVAVIDFWATWCKPCHLANKDIAELHEEYKDTDVTFIAVNVDKIKK